MPNICSALFPFLYCICNSVLIHFGMIERVTGGVPVKYSGPNVCGDREHGYVCCSGWKISLLTGLCVLRSSPCANGIGPNGPCEENMHHVPNSNTEQLIEKPLIKNYNIVENQQLFGGFPLKKVITRNMVVEASCREGMQCVSKVSPGPCTGNQCDNTNEIPVGDIHRGDCPTDDCLISLPDGFVPLQDIPHQAPACPDKGPCIIPQEKSENSINCKGSDCLPLFDLNLLHSSPLNDQPPRENTTESDSNERKGRGGRIYASNDAICRGDLCNDPVRRKQLLAPQVPDKDHPKTDLKIPLKTYWTIPQITPTETPSKIPAKTPFTTSVKTSSKISLKTPSEKSSFCPIGYRIVTRGEFDFCEPLPGLDLKSGTLSKKESQVRCEGEQQLIITPDGEKCGKLDLKQVCPKGQLTILVEDGIECVKQGKVGKMSACPPGYTPRNIPEGIVCQFPDVESVPECPKGRIPVLSDSGFVCVEEVVPQPLCPDGFELVDGDKGFVCVHVNVCPSGEVAVETEGGRRICQSMNTESPCPAGLIPVETPVGRLCQYVPPAELQILHCLPGQLFVDDNGEATCVGKGGDIKCPPGQVLVETDSGVFCGFAPESCPQGQIEINGPNGIECRKYESRTHNVNPCPPDQELDQTGERSKCIYRQDGNRGFEKVEFCGQGQVLTLFPRRFICGPDILTSTRRQCSLGTHVAIDAYEYICISDTEARMICSEDEKLTDTGGTFACLPNIKMDNVPVCGPGEIRIQNGQTKKCVSVGEGRELCNEGYKAVPTGDGFVCKPTNLQIECPPGFILTLQKGLPTCVGQTGTDCTTDDLIKKDCVSAGATLNPCADGYFPIEVDETYQCWLEGEHPLPCGEEDDGTYIRPCDIKLEDLRLQCNPECANGGTCKNGTCVCPDGITGTACQEDIDECVLQPKGHCEFRCQNHFGGYSCVCPTGFTLNTDDRTCKGVNCVPGCLNGGTCIGGTCTCPPGLTGDRCQHDVDECTQPFGNRLCEHYCRNTLGSFACICPPGSRLQDDKRTCVNTTCIPACKNGARCENHRCICLEGFQGIICQLDINECHRDQPCSHICQNTRGSFRCACPTGYVLDDDARSCEVIATSKYTGSP